MDKVVRKVCIDLTRDLVLATPVLNGFAKSNYFFGNERNPGTDATPSKTGTPSNSRSDAFASTLTSGGVFYITNNLPYIMKLEFGSSTQAPNGMARRTVDRWQERVNKIAGEIAR